MPRSAFRLVLVFAFCLHAPDLFAQEGAQADRAGAQEAPRSEEMPRSAEVPTLSSHPAPELLEPRASFGAAMKRIPGDIWHTVSFDTAKITAIGLAAGLAAHQSDNGTLEEFQEDARFRALVKPGNLLGSFAVQAGGAFGAYMVGRWSGHPRLAEIGLDVMRAQIVTQTFVQATKFSVNRQRPDGTSFSFPSGHVATTFATAGVLHRHLGWKVGLPVYGLGAYVGAARMAHNRHYMSDVIVGAAAGLASAYSLRISHGAHQWRVSPSAGMGAVGVSVSISSRP